MAGMARALEDHLKERGEFAWYTPSVDQEDQQHADVHVHPILRDPDDPEQGWNWVFQLMTTEQAQYLYEERMIWNDYYEDSPEHDDETRNPPEHARDDDESIIVDVEALWDLDDAQLSQRIKKRLEHMTGLSGEDFTVRRLTDDALSEAMGEHPMFAEIQERADEIDEMSEEERDEKLISMDEVREEMGMEPDPTKSIHELRRDVRLAALSQRYYDQPMHTLTEKELERAAEAFGEEYSDVLIDMWEFKREHLDDGDDPEVRAMPDVLDKLT